MRDGNAAISSWAIRFVAVLVFRFTGRGRDWGCPRFLPRPMESTSQRLRQEMVVTLDRIAKCMEMRCRHTLGRFSTLRL